MTQTQKFRLIAFVLIFAVLCTWLPHRLYSCDENRNTPKAQEFLDEAPNSLDGVFLGSSYVYSFWEPPIAWEDEGIAVYSYTASCLPAAAMRYVMADCLKTQPDALYILEVKTLLDFPRATDLHFLFDYMPNSINKLQAIHAASRFAGISYDEELEVYVPFFLFHSNWNAVFDNTDHSFYGLKGAANYPLFWMQENITTGLEPGNAELSESQLDTLNDLLDFCDDCGAQVLFIATPGFADSPAYLSQLDTMGQIIQGRGYDFINCMAPGFAVSMDLNADYYNAGHANVGGAVKFTDYFSQYLVQEYGFTDKRGQPGWESWDASVEQYKNIIWEHLWEFHSPRYGPPPGWEEAPPEG